MFYIPDSFPYIDEKRSTKLFKRVMEEYSSKVKQKTNPNPSPKRAKTI